MQASMAENKVDTAEKHSRTHKERGKKWARGNVKQKHLKRFPKFKIWNRNTQQWGGIYVSGKTLVAAPRSHVRDQGLAHWASHFLLMMHEPWEAAVSDSCCWVSVTHVGDLYWVTWHWVWPGPALTTTGIRAVDQQTRASCCPSRK